MLPALSIPDWRLPALSIPDWRPPPEAAWSGLEEDATPRDPSPAKSVGSLPSSPSARKTKSRARNGYFRSNNSLKDAKVLLVSDLHRTESAMDPSLFQYHQHFEGPWHLVGKTHLSEVFRVRHRASGEVFAVKRSRHRFRSKLQRERCLREIRAVAALPSHPNIVNQYRAWQEGGYLHIQMSFCEGGSLQAHQASGGGRAAGAHGEGMSDEQLWTTACQVAQGLRFLHSHGVLHLDIKPENIYLSAGTWRIGDFGLAVARDKDGGQDWEEGDGDYVAPELLQAGGEPLPASDIFSLGATLYDCATGRKLPRSDGWKAGDPERLQVPGRPPAFVQLLRAMLQPSPALRPTAQHVLEVVAREQPATAAAVAEAVAAATQAGEAAATAACQAAISGAVPFQQAAQALAPSPFQQGAEGPAGQVSPPAAVGQPARQATAAAPPPPFSFDGSHSRPASFAFTPGQPPRHRSSGSAFPRTATKGTPVHSGRMGGRWAPALSPLISEGALTPGAAAALAGLTPGARGSSDRVATPTLGQHGGGCSERLAVVAATPLDLRRPTPLQVPPQTASMAAASSSSSGMPSARQLSSGGTQDSRDGWRLSRRDIISPDSDALGSQSDSDYSYSCGTGKTMSDLDFADALSPMSQEVCGLASHGAAVRPTPPTGTPDSLRPWQDGQAGSTPGTDLHDSLPLAAQPGLGAEAWPAGRLQAAPSLAWDLHTSPEFLMQLPPGSPESLSRSSSLDEMASLPSRATSVRRFPTLDSWGSQLHLDAVGGSACNKLHTLPDCLAPQRFTVNVAARDAARAAPTADGAAAAPAGATTSGPRKRQHSSRRTLMAALSRDNSAASSLDGMQPLGKARHIQADSAPSSPGAGQLSAGPPRMLHRSSSTLGREAAAAGLVEAAAKALAAAASPLPIQRPPRSPLHARMTCMKLRDSD